MIYVLVIVLIALTFGFVFSKLDTLSKTNKIIFGELQKLQTKLDKISNKDQ